MDTIFTKFLLFLVLALNYFKSAFAKNGQLGGYVHDTAMTLFVPPTCVYGDTATWAVGAGDTAGTLVYACDATAETANLFIPIPVPANSVDGKGSYLKSIEVDYLIKTAACTSVTASMNKVALAVDGTAPTVTNPAVTQDSDRRHRCRRRRRPQADRHPHHAGMGRPRRSLFPQSGLRQGGDEHRAIPRRERQLHAEGVSMSIPEAVANFAERMDSGILKWREEENVYVIILSDGRKYTMRKDDPLLTKQTNVPQPNAAHRRKKIENT